jgi:hypothetical protein
MKVRLTTMTLALLLAADGNVWAAEPRVTEAPAPTEAGTQQPVVDGGASPGVDADAKTRADPGADSPDEFVPTENISEDAAVPFPVDI